MAVLAWLRRLEERALDIAFPRCCVGCGKEGGWLCGACADGIPAGLETWEEDGRAYSSLLPFESAAVRELLHYLKYNGIYEAAACLAGLCTKRPEGDVLIPVPVSWQRLRQRGYNQAELLARELGRRWGMPVWPGAVLRARHTESQVGRSLSERQETGRFAWAGKEGYTGKRLVIVDDVWTTGATLRECLSLVPVGWEASGLAVAKRHAKAEAPG